LTAITVDASNSVFSSVDGVLFNNSQTTLILWPYGKAGNYTIPDSVTNIGGYAFNGCPGLTNVTIPNSITSIGNFAFYYCSGLTNITIGNSVTSIGDGAFYGCQKLASVRIPNSVTSIGSYAFQSCYGLTSVTIGNSVTNIGNEAFRSCTSLTSVTIGNSVTTIGNGAFDGCTRLTSVTLPNSVTSIGIWAFDGCTRLTSVTLPNSVTSIGFWAFYDCTRLTSLYFEGNAPILGSQFSAIGSNPTVYYLSGMTGWGATFGGIPTKLWNPQAQTGDTSFGVQANQFGFNITGSINLVIIVEVCTNLANPVWSPLSTNTLNTFIGTNGTSYFSDPQWTNYPGRFYRLRSP
jgi:hypothetical protein